MIGSINIDKEGYFMKLKIKEFNQKDERFAIQFAIEGMHFHWYTKNKLLLNLYGRYFWYLEKLRATQVIALYADEQLAGVLLAKMKGEPRKYHSFLPSLYIRLCDYLQKTLFKDGVGIYEQANQMMFKEYSQHTIPDGEILFLAANPSLHIKGIGTLLLEEFEKREPQKTVYLYTDHACTYQFYEHRGFQRVGQKDILLKIGKNEVELQCFLYSKTIV